LTGQEISPAPDRLRDRIELLEEAYEYFLSYAARGLQGDGEDEELRSYLERSAAAAREIPDLFREAAATVDGSDREEMEAFGRILEEDARRAGVAIRLVASRPGVSSQLIDNLNVSTHVRALLTDLFLVDEALKTPAAGPREERAP